MKAGKILIPIAVVGVVGAATYVIYRYFKKKNDEKKAAEFRKANPFKPLTESQLQQTGKSFTDFLERLKKGRDTQTLIPNTQPKGFAQSGGFGSPSLLNTQSSIFQPINQPLGTINFKPKF
jgi:hypothetical protein